MERASGVPDDNHSKIKAAPAVKQHVATSLTAVSDREVMNVWIWTNT